MTSTDVVKQQVQQAAMAGASDQPTVFTLIKQQQKAIERALPKHLSGDRFARIAMTLVRQTPKLLECEPMSFVGALMVSAQLGLEPGPPLGLSWIIPRYNSQTRRQEANFQMGYKGVIELFRRSGQFLSIQAHEVCEGDDFDYAYGLDDHLTHRPLLTGDRGQPFAYYAIARFKDGGHAFVVLPRSEVEKRRARGQDGKAWKTDYDAMAGKTCVMALAPWLPLSPELERQLATDGRTFHTITPDLDDLPELEAGDGDDGQEGTSGSSTSTEEPKTATPLVEDATGDETEIDEPAAETPPAPPADAEPPSWSTKDEDQWSAAEWKEFVKARGVKQVDAIQNAQRLAGEFPGEKEPSGFADLKGQTRLCQLVRGWVEDQAQDGAS